MAGMIDWIRRLFRPENNGPRVHYAAVFQSKGGPATKLRLLRGRFPDCPRRFNVLYLMSAGRLDFALVERAKLRGVKVVLNQNGVYFPALKVDDWKERNAAMRRMIEVSDVVLFQSEFSRVAASRFLCEPFAAWEVLPNGVDTTRFLPSGESAGGPCRLLTTSLVTNDYLMAHFERLLHALARLRERREDWHLTCAGTLSPGPYEDRARSLAAEMGLRDRVTWLPRFSGAEAPTVYRQADVYLHFKTNDWCPNTVLEAMASGLPVVHCAAGGAAELVGDSGVAVAGEVTWNELSLPDADAYTDAISVAMDRRRELGNAARMRAVELFDLKMWLARHDAVFNGLLSEGGA